MNNVRRPRDFYVLGTGPRPLAQFDLVRLADLVEQGRVTQQDVDTEMTRRRADAVKMSEGLRRYGGPDFGGTDRGGWSRPVDDEQGRDVHFVPSTDKRK